MDEVGVPIANPSFCTCFVHEFEVVLVDYDVWQFCDISFYVAFIQMFWHIVCIILRISLVGMFVYMLVILKKASLRFWSYEISCKSFISCVEFLMFYEVCV